MKISLLNASVVRILYLDFMKNLWYLLFFFLCSCSSEKENLLVQKCTHEKIQGYDSYILGRPVCMALADSILTISDSQISPMLHLLNIKTGRYVGRFISRGQGPNEFRDIATLEKFAGDTLFFHDLNKRVCAYFILPKSNGDDVCLLSAFSCRDVPHNTLLPLNNGAYIATGIYEDGRYCLLTDSGKMKRFIGTYPSRDKEEKVVSNLVKSQAYMGSISVSPSKDRFVSCASQADLLSFYKYENGEIQLVKEIQNSFPDYEYGKDMKVYMGVKRSNPVTYLDVCSTEKFVYLLYSGKNYEKDQLKAFTSNKIHVYNWNGEKVKVLSLDVDVDKIVVSEDDGVMYSIANLPDPMVVSFRL